MVYYLGANLEWFGRQLNSYIIEDDAETTDVNESLNVSYTYDANGLRGSKTVNGVKSDYLYLDGKLVYEKKGDVDIYYNYDSYGNFAGMKWYDAAGTAYALYALTNAQGDVLGLYNGNGELKIAYTYDTWGKVLSETDAQGNPLTGNLIEYSKLNPFRYRGYYYDSETGLYYLQSRYYNPEIGRFLNSDNITDPGAGVLAFNTFMYCANNPVNASDPSGHALLTTLLVGFVVGAVVSAIAEAGCQYLDDGKVSNWRKVGCSALVGGVFGAISGGASSAIANSAISATKKAVFSIVSDSVFNVIENATNSLLRGETFTAEIAAKSFVQGAVSSTLGFGASSFIKYKNITKFNKLSNNKKKILMNSHSDGTHIIRSFIRSDDFLKSDVYTKYISRGTVAGEKATSSITSLSFCFYENEH